MVSYLDPTKYTGTQQYYVPAALQTKKLRDPTTSDLKNPTSGGNYKISTIWVNQATDVPWMLTNVVGNVATWVPLIPGTPALLEFDVDYEPISGMPPTSPGHVVPTPTGVVDIDGGHNVVVEQQNADPNNFEMRLHAPYWFETSANIAAADTRPNFGYITNSGSLITVGLPTTIEVGQTFHITGKGAGGWAISQSANQQVHFGIASTTIGVGGSLASTKQRDAMHLVCVVANLEFNVVNAIGNITIV